MRKVLVFTVVTTMLAGCHLNDPAQNYKGVYVSSYAHEYARGNDTLVIARYGDNSFTIRRLTGFRRIRAGKEKPLEHSERSYTGIYQPDSKTLLLPNPGVTLVLSEDKSKLKWGAVEYVRNR